MKVPRPKEGHFVHESLSNIPPSYTAGQIKDKHQNNCFSHRLDAI